MAGNVVNQTGDKSIYIERNEGTVYVGGYKADPKDAFTDGSYELEAYEPFIQPPIVRKEVDEILKWIEIDTPEGKANRVALLYGSAGIGKSVVMHDVFLKARSNPDYLVLGLKSDQIEFVDTDDLAHQMHLAQPLTIVIKEMVTKVKRVVILIDQIDALSLSLSSNRTPLRSLLKLIGQLRLTRGVRIVISCRPYDKEYDPDLDNLKITNSWELRNIPTTEVKSVLENYSASRNVNDQLLSFLGNPLNLVLYLKVFSYAELKSPLTQEVLYNELWNAYIVNVTTNAIDRNTLLELLDALVNTMYKRQELSVHIRDFETKFHKELAYLLHDGILTCNKNGQIQFFHQTMFDYVYARRFVENGKDLLEDLYSQHQGLFSRAAVKSILSFQRETDSKLYKRNLEQILFAKNTENKDKYRFHIKSLALSNMTYFDMPKKEEIDLIGQKIYRQEQYFGVILESVHTGKWFNAIWSIIDSMGGWPSLTNNCKEKVMVMCHRTLWSDADAVLDVANKILSYGKEEDKTYINNLLSYHELNCTVDKLLELYKKLSSVAAPLEFASLLKNIIKDAPEFVCSEIERNVEIQLASKEKPTYRLVTFNHDEEELFETLEKLHHEKAIDLYVKLLGMILEASKFEIPGSEIFNSFEFSHFQRTTGGHFVNDFTEDITNKLIDDFEKNSETLQVRKYLSEFSKSEYDGYVFIALCIFTKYANIYVNEIYSIITTRKILSDAPCWVEFQGLEALKASFSFMDETQKQKIITLAETLTDCGEYKLYDTNRASYRLQYGIPLLDVDVHKGKVLYAINSIDSDILKRTNWNAYQDLLRIKRKYTFIEKDGKPSYNRLENEQPFKTFTKSGWTSLGTDKAVKMSCATWYKSMTKYVDNNSFDWSRPTLTGQCQLFRNLVSKYPDKYISFVDDIATDEKILLTYVESGMRGLIDAGRLVEAEHIFSLILSQTGNNINSTYRGFDIHSFLFAVDDFIKKNYVTQSIFYFLCNAVLYANESEVDDNTKKSFDICNIGINQARGHAGYLLVECYSHEEYKDKLFETLEAVAKDSSAYTRSAILLNMAVLNCLDKDRNLELFLMMLHDYDPRLMALPVHNHNPLVYFINYAVDRLIDFFRRASETPLCYKQQVILLWLAWSHNSHHKAIKPLLDKVCEESEDARIALLHFLCTLEEQMNEDAVEYILHFMSPQYVTKEMGEQCDNIFHHMDEWEDDIQKRIATAYINSPMTQYAGRSFMTYLAGLAISEPITALSWLEIILNQKHPDDYNMWNQVTDVLIQSYNGIKSFDNEEYKDILEKAMDMMDQLMQSKDNKYLITNFISKLDNE